MPGSFKALATILVWVLWISGLLIGFSTLILGIVRGHLFSVNTLTGYEYPTWFAVALAYGVGAVIVMRIRQKMD